MQQSQAEGKSSTRVILPSSASINQFLTSLLVLNHSPIAGQVTIRSWSSGGLVQATEDRSIPAYGLLQYDDFYGAVGLSDVFGPIEVLASGGIQITATTRIYTQQGTSGYFQGIASQGASKRVVLPFTVENADFRTNRSLE